VIEAALYHVDGMWGEATFDLAPVGPGWVVAAGVDAAIQAVAGLRFPSELVDWLASQPPLRALPAHFFESLRHFQFSGEIWSVDEGTPVFSGQPLLRVTGSLPHIPLISTLLMGTISRATAVATEAAHLRVVTGLPLSDRGVHITAGAPGARAAYIAGCDTFADLGAAAMHGLPPRLSPRPQLLTAYEDPQIAAAACRQFYGADIDARLWTPADLPRLRRMRLHTLEVSLADLSALGEQLAALRRSGVAVLCSLRRGERPTAGLAVDGLVIDAALRGPAGLSLGLSELMRGPDADPVSGPLRARWPGRKQILRRPDRDLLCLCYEADVRTTGGVPLLRARLSRGRVTERASPQTYRARCQRALDELPRSALKGTAERVIELSTGVAKLQRG